jgi:CheY-like chemotaxis protein
MRHAALVNKLVLVVDDDPESRLLLTSFIEGLGADVMTAHTAEQGMQIALSYQPDLVVMDLNLPDGDGWQALERLRAHPATAHLRAIVVSGAIEGREEIVCANVDAVSKPVDPEALLAAVARNVRRQRGRVLIVDDSAEDRHLLAAYLKAQVAEIHTAGDGIEALALMEDLAFDLVVLDLSMPRMDGFAFLRALAERGGAAPPVLVVSGRAMSAEERAFVREHATGLVGKRGEVGKLLRRTLLSLLAEDVPPAAP